MTAVDNDLRCNNYQCRAQLGMEAQAVVTTCSHIFCCELLLPVLSSVRSFPLSARVWSCVVLDDNCHTQTRKAKRAVDCAGQQLSGRICPACEQLLEDDNDIIVCTLSPTTKYKTTILAGMTPAIILEVASRALGFWTYQTSQEAAFQSMALKKTNSRLEEARQANGGMHNELAPQRAIKDYENQLNNEKRRSHGFEQALKEKERELLKMKGMSDNMMKRAMLGNAAQNEMLRNNGHQPAPLEAGRQQDRRRMMAGTPLATTHTQQTFRPTPQPSQSRNPGNNTGGGPFFYPKIPSATSAYNSRPAPSPATFQLHPTRGTGHAQGSVARQRVARDINTGGQAGNRNGSEVPSEEGRRLRGRQPVGPAYFGAP